MNHNEVKLNIKYAVVSGVYWMICAVSTIFIVPLLREKGMDNSQIGLLISIRSLAALGISPLIAGFLDRNPKVQLKYVIMVLAGINIVNTLVFQYVKLNFWQMVINFVILGGTTNTMPPLHSSMAMKFNKPGNTVVYNIGRGTGSVAYAVISLVLGYMVGETHLYLSMVLQISLDIGTILALMLFPDYDTGEAGQNKTFAKNGGKTTHTNGYLLKYYPWFTLFLAASAFMFVGYNMCNSFMIDIITDRGGTNSDMGISCFILGVSELPTAILFQRLKKRFGVYKLLRISAVFSLVKMVFLWLSPNVFFVCLSQVFQMLGNGMYWPVSVYYVNEVIPKEDLVKGQSLTTIFSVNIGAILGSVFSGQLLKYFDINGLIVFGCVCSLAGAAVMFLAMRQSERKCAGCAGGQKKEK